MQERRSNQRISIPGQVALRDHNTGETLGFLVNLSVSGLLMISNSPQEIGRIVQIVILLPAEVDGGETIEVGCECLWSDTEEGAGRNWGGFRIIDLSETAEKRIAGLVERYRQ